MSSATPRISILNDPNVKELIKRFDLVAFPAEYMDRLEAGRPYDLHLVHDRLKTIGAITCTVEDFRMMVDQEEGFRVARNNIFRIGKMTPERNEWIIDPCQDE